MGIAITPYDVFGSEIRGRCDVAISCIFKHFFVEASGLRWSLLRSHRKAAETRKKGSSWVGDQLTVYGSWHSSASSFKSAAAVNTARLAKLKCRPTWNILFSSSGAHFWRREKKNRSYLEIINICVDFEVEGTLQPCRALFRNMDFLIARKTIFNPT